jgi:hypothetical protein
MPPRNGGEKLGEPGRDHRHLVVAPPNQAGRLARLDVLARDCAQATLRHLDFDRCGVMTVTQSVVMTADPGRSIAWHSIHGRHQSCR